MILLALTATPGSSGFKPPVHVPVPFPKLAVPQEAASPNSRERLSLFIPKECVLDADDSAIGKFIPRIDPSCFDLDELQYFSCLDEIRTWKCAFRSPEPSPSRRNFHHWVCFDRDGEETYVGRQSLHNAQICLREYCRATQHSMPRHGMLKSLNQTACDQFGAGIEAQGDYRISMASP